MSGSPFFVDRAFFLPVETDPTILPSSANR